MPVPVVAGIIGGISWLFRSRIGTFIASALAWAGLTYGTQKVVMGPFLSVVEGYIQGMAGASSLGAVAFNWIGVLHFDVVCTMILSAVTTKMSMQAAKVMLKKG